MSTHVVVRRERSVILANESTPAQNKVLNVLLRREGSTYHPIKCVSTYTMTKMAKRSFELKRLVVHLSED